MTHELPIGPMLCVVSCDQTLIWKSYEMHEAISVSHVMLVCSPEIAAQGDPDSSKLLASISAQ